jgi:molecular chaperone GrpE
MRGENMAEEKKNDEVQEETKDVKEETKQPEASPEKEEKPQEEKKADQDQEIADLKEEANKWKTEYYKVFADMQNTQKRLTKEFDNTKKFMMQNFIEDLLPVVDNFERSLASEANDESLKNFLKGYQMIHDQLMNILEKNGVKAIEAKVGDDFDPNLHQAIMTEKVDGMEPNKITEELQKGYMLKDRVIRATLVKVSE